MLHTLSTNKAQYKPTELVLIGSDGAASKITVSLKYLPIKMQLDPSESINNMGTLRVDVLDAADLPSADRNGFSDPFCKFDLNGKKVYETKVQKKTLHPAWNEYFEVSINSRTAADFKVRVMDWDFGDKADFLGAAAINLELLEPFRPQEFNLALDGKSGAIRLKLLFKPAYVTRSRQGSSTFSGTFATPGKVIGAPVKGVGKVGGVVGGGMIKGASFLRHGFKGSDRRDTSNTGEAELTNGNMAAIPSIEEPERSGPNMDAAPFTAPQHNRTASFGASSMAGGVPNKAEAGIASLTVVSASGFPPSTKVQVLIKQLTSRGSKDVHKTKPIKSSSGQVEWEQEQEMARVNCLPDTQFQVQVKDHTMFGGEDLGEAPFFIDDSSTGSEKTISVGPGSVVLKTSFAATNADASVVGSPKGTRRSLLSRRDFSRGSTPSNVA